MSTAALFADRQAFELLERRIIPGWLARSEGAALRLWVLDCGAGAEVYALAATLLRAYAERGWAPTFTIFGTERSETQLQRARAGIYSPELVAGMPKERLAEFFTRVERGYEIHRSVRSHCVIARHELARNPPFLHLDLIRCRDLLAATDPARPQSAAALLHYALRPGGVLWIGPQRGSPPPAELFAAVGRSRSLYGRLPGAGSVQVSNLGARPTPAVFAVNLAPRPVRLREALPEHPGPGVILDERWEVLRFCGETGAYLRQPPGPPTTRVLALARPGVLGALCEAVRSALAAAPPAEAVARTTSGGRPLQVRARVLGTDPADGVRRLLVLFEPEAAAVPVPSPAEPDRELERLRRELRAALEPRSAEEPAAAGTAEDAERSAELQCVNEELEAAKEELESTNEQLRATNAELSARVDELARLNDDLSNVLESVQIPILILDRELAIRRFTPAAAPLFNLIPGDVGRPLSQLQGNLDAPWLALLLLEVRGSGVPQARDVRDRSGRCYTLRVHPYRTRQGRIDGLLLVWVDVQEIAAARDFAEAIVATVRRPLLVLDAELRVQRANPEFYRTFRLSPESAEGRPLPALGSGEWQLAPLLALLGELCEHDAHFDDAEVDADFAELGQRTLCASGRRLESAVAGQRPILLVLEDVTQRRQAERRLLEADARKNEFLAMLAHELRNPLAPVVNAAELLRHGHAQADPTARRALEIIGRQTAHMKRLVDDLLEVSRITHGRVELRRRRMDLREAVEASAAAVELEMAAQRHRLAVELPAQPLWVEADPARIEQIVGNLLSNAAKYTPAGGRVTLRAEARAGRALLCVRDTGVGICPEALPRVFELFVQAESTLDRRSGGLGIGLTVVKNLVEMHGGTVAARSAPGQGSEFSIRLPLLPDGGPQASEAAPAHAAAPTATAASAVRRRILVVDDNPDAAEMLSQLLRFWGHEVRTAADGPAGLGAATEFHPQIVLLDLGLPGMSGYEVARELRRRPDPQPPLLVALTGYGQEDDLRQSRRAGFDLHLIKPVSPEALRELLERELH